LRYPNSARRLARAPFAIARAFGYGSWLTFRRELSADVDPGPSPRVTSITLSSHIQGPRVLRMSDTIAENVIATLASVKRIPVEGIKLETPLQELGIDSLDTFTLLFELESKFNISIPDDEARNIRTVNDIVEGIRKLVNANNSGSSTPSAAPAD
jgi:acyl carrier protein